MNNHATPKSWGDIWYYVVPPPPLKSCNACERMHEPSQEADSDPKGFSEYDSIFVNRPLVYLSSS